MLLDLVLGHQIGASEVAEAASLHPFATLEVQSELLNGEDLLRVYALASVAHLHLLDDVRQDPALNVLEHLPPFHIAERAVLPCRWNCILLKLLEAFIA